MYDIVANFEVNRWKCIHEWASRESTPQHPSQGS